MMIRLEGDAHIYEQNVRRAYFREALAEIQ